MSSEILFETTEPERLIDPDQASPEEETIDRSLRPKTLADFVGQHHIKDPLLIALHATKKRQEPMEHVLLYGNPGLGKTTLASIIAGEMNAHMTITSGPALERVGDLAAILTGLSPHDVLFIDEIHRMNKTIEEVLYSAMEDFALDIIVGKGPGAKTLRMPVPPFTLIGATTKLNLLSNPLRDRFGHVFHLTFYTPEDIETILRTNAKRLEVELSKEAAEIIATRARRTPRVANRLLKRVRDFAEVKGNGIISLDIAHSALRLLEVDKEGLDHVDRKLLQAIIKTFQGGPVGLQTLAATIAEDMETIETVYEPYLLQIGMLERTPRGRKATQNAYLHLGLTPPTLL